MNVKIKVFRSQEWREELWHEKFNRKRSTSYEYAEENQQNFSGIDNLYAQ